MKKLILSVLACCTLPAHGQEADVRMEIVTIALEQPVYGLFFDNGGEIARFQAIPTGLGQPLKYHGPRRFILRTSEADFSRTTRLPPPHAWVDLPTDSDRVLLACLKRGDAPVKMLAYDIGRARISAGDYRFFNFSRSPLAIMIGERRLRVGSGEDTLVSRPSWGREVGEIDVAVAVIGDDRTRPVYSSQWGNRPGRRNYVFMFDGPHDYNPIRIARFFDVLPADAE